MVSKTTRDTVTPILLHKGQSSPFDNEQKSQEHKRTILHLLRSLIGRKDSEVRLGGEQGIFLFKEPLNGHKFSEALTEKVSFNTPNFVSPKSLSVKYVRTIFPSPPLVWESTFGFKPGTNNNQNIKSRYDAKNSSPQSTPQVLLSFEVYTPPMTYSKEVEETIGILMEVEPLDESQLEDLGLNTCHELFLSSREIPSFDEPEPQPNLLPNFSPLDVNLGNKRGNDPPIKPHSPDSFRMKVVDKSTINTPPLPHVTSFHSKDTYYYSHPCMDDPKKHYGFKPGLLGQNGSLGVDFSNLDMIENDWELESKEVSFLGRGLNSPVRPKEVEKVIFDEKKLGSS
ncbi:hypothetical protein Tco_0331473 [Tanacetum coccineum]